MDYSDSNKKNILKTCLSKHAMIIMLPGKYIVNIKRLNRRTILQFILLVLINALKLNNIQWFLVGENKTEFVYTQDIWVPKRIHCVFKITL